MTSDRKRGPHPGLRWCEIIILLQTHFKSLDYRIQADFLKQRIEASFHKWNKDPFYTWDKICSFFLIFQNTSLPVLSADFPLPPPCRRVSFACIVVLPWETRVGGEHDCPMGPRWGPQEILAKIDSKTTKSQETNTRRHVIVDCKPFSRCWRNTNKELVLC